MECPFGRIFDVIEQKTLKLLALAFDDASPDGEASSAFLAAKRQVNEAGGWWELMDSLKAVQAPKLDPIFGFGKYRGRHVSAVLASDPGYLEWLLENCKGLSGILRAAIQDQLQSVTT